MKVLGQIASIQPLALIISLPNQLMGHVPITQVTSQLTSRLESMHEQEELLLQTEEEMYRLDKPVTANDTEEEEQIV